jgi:hypothetical protein
MSDECLRVHLRARVIILRTGTCVGRLKALPIHLILVFVLVLASADLLIQYLAFGGSLPVR